MAARKKTTKRPLSDALPPAVPVSPRHFEADLRRRAAELSNIIDAELAGFWREYTTGKKRTLRELLAAALARTSVPPTRDVTRMNVVEVSRATAIVVNAQLGAPLHVFDPPPKALVRNAVARTGVLGKLHKKKVGQVLRAAVSAASGAPEAGRKVQREHARADRRARNTARQLTSEVMSAETQRRNEDLGIDRYMWISSHDERVRPLHRRLSGTVHEWAKPPIADERTGRKANPGKIWGCRCTASPLKEDVLDLLNGPGDL